MKAMRSLFFVVLGLTAEFLAVGAKSKIKINTGKAYDVRCKLCVRGGGIFLGESCFSGTTCVDELQMIMDDGPPCQETTTECNKLCSAMDMKRSKMDKQCYPVCESMMPMARGGGAVLFGGRRRVIGRVIGGGGGDLDMSGPGQSAGGGACSKPGYTCQEIENGAFSASGLCKPGEFCSDDCFNNPCCDCSNGQEVLVECGQCICPMGRRLIVNSANYSCVDYGADYELQMQSHEHACEAASGANYTICQGPNWECYNPNTEDVQAPHDALQVPAPAPPGFGMGFGGRSIDVPLPCRGPKIACSQTPPPQCQNGGKADWISDDDPCTDGCGTWKCEDHKCGMNEEYKECYSSGCAEAFCEAGVAEQPGMFCIKNCANGCVCAKGFARAGGRFAVGGDCIPEVKCGVCGGGLECGDVCATSQGMLQVMQYCQPDFSCAPSVVQDADCPVVPDDRCEAGEVWADCYSGSCKEPTCRLGQLHDFVGQPCTLDCNQGCICQDGFVRKDTGDCIPEKKCGQPEHNVCDKVNADNPADFAGRLLRQCDMVSGCEFDIKKRTCVKSPDVDNSGCKCGDECVSVLMDVYVIGGMDYCQPDGSCDYMEPSRNDCGLGPEPIDMCVAQIEDRMLMQYSDGPRFRFDPVSNTCTKHREGSRFLAENGFLSMNACEKKCGNELTKDIDLCDHFMEDRTMIQYNASRWKYDPSTKTCDKRKSGSTILDKVGFTSLGACEKECGVNVQSQGPDMCVQQKEDKMYMQYQDGPRYRYDDKISSCTKYAAGSRFLAENGFRSLDACMKKCGDQNTREIDLCNIVMEDRMMMQYDTPRFVYDGQGNTCKERVRGSKMIGLLGFLTLDGCSSQCVVADAYIGDACFNEDAGCPQARCELWPGLQEYCEEADSSLEITERGMCCKTDPCYTVLVIPGVTLPGPEESCADVFPFVEDDCKDYPGTLKKKNEKALKKLRDKKDKFVQKAIKKIVKLTRKLRKVTKKAYVLEMVELQTDLDAAFEKLEASLYLGKRVERYLEMCTV